MSYLIVVISSILFGIIPSLQSLIMLGGASPVGTMTIAMSISTALSFVLSKLQKNTLCITKQQVFPILVSGLCLCLTDLLLDISYTIIPVGLTTMIHFMYPTIVCIINVLFFKEKGNKKIIISIIFAIIGLFCLGTADLHINYFGIICALITAGTYGSYMILSGRSPLNSIPTQIFVFYVSLISSFIGWIIVCFSHAAIPNLISNGWLVILSSTMLFSATFLLKVGIKRIGSTTASLLSVIEPVTSLLFSTIMYSYHLNIITLLGCMFLLLSLVPVLKQ